jgi:hypothetical protein
MNISKDINATVKTALLGAVGGALVTAIVGFNWGGWMLGSTAQKVAEMKANESMVLALASICVENFRHQADAGVQLDSLLKLSSSDQRNFVEKGGWAAMLGTKEDRPAINIACAQALSKLTAADL